MHTKLKFLFETIELDGSIIAVPVGEHASQFHGVIKLNETGAALLEMLKNDVSEEEIVQALSSQFTVPAETVSEDVHQFISLFQEKGVLV